MYNFRNRCLPTINFSVKVTKKAEKSRFVRKIRSKWLGCLHFPLHLIGHSWSKVKYHWQAMTEAKVGVCNGNRWRADGPLSGTRRP